MDKQKPTASTSRFSDTANRSRTQAAVRPSARQQESTRRPSGFGTTGQTRKARPASEPVKAAKEKPAKKKRIPKEREPGKNRPVLRALLAIGLAAVLVSVLMVLIFGGEDTTYHQMPTIERESIAQFEPEETPIPGMEDL